MSHPPVFTFAAISSIAKSPTNPRKIFPAEYISELAASIAAKGIISPLLVRSTNDLPAPVGHVYELIAGECRLRAAEQAGLSEVPVLVRDDLSPNDVLELQLIENLQRRELSVLEEAESYGALLELADGGRKRHSLDSLASAISKSTHYIRERLNLLRLPEAAKVALSSGELTFSVARLLATIPSPALREKALEEVLHPTYEEEPLTARKAAVWIREHFMTELKKVPFDRSCPDLVPVEHDTMGQRVKGGACSDCPWLSGNLPAHDESHPGSGNPDLCMHPGCLSEKLSASWEESRMEALKAGKRVLSDEEAASEVSSYESGLAWNSKYVLLSATVPSAELADGSGKPPTWKKLLSKVSVKPEIVVMRDRNHRPLECVLKREAIAAIKLESEKGGIPSPLKSREAASPEEKEAKKAVAAVEKRERVVAKDALHRCMKDLFDLFAGEKAPEDAVLWPRLLDIMLEGTSYVSDSALAEYLDVESEGLCGRLLDYPVGDSRKALAPAILLLGLLAGHYELPEEISPAVKLWFGNWGIDTDAHLKASEEAHPAPAPEKKEKADKAKGARRKAKVSETVADEDAEEESVEIPAGEDFEGSEELVEGA